MERRNTKILLEMMSRGGNDERKHREIVGNDE